MDFFTTNNLNRQDFACYLSEWTGGERWTPGAQGYPALKFDLRTQNLFLHFQGLGHLDSFKVYNLVDFKFAINQRRHVLSFELNDCEVDVALSFKQMDSCVRFKALLIHYIQLRRLIREEAERVEKRGRVHPS